MIIGASGDLTKRKLLPAIYNLAETGHLPKAFAILGVARQPGSDEQFRREMRECVEKEEGEPLEPDKWRAIEERLHYVSGELTDPALYSRMKETLATLAGEQQVPPNYLFYFAIPPDLFATVARHLADAGLLTEDAGWRRVIIEKPFGYDLRQRAGAQCRAVDVPEGIADLPDRSLPREGDRSEHPGVPIRQRHLRADLEPPLRRSRADDRGRGRRHRDPRQLLRQGRCTARHRAEPHVPAADAGRDGAADLVPGARTCRTKR